MRTPEVQWAIDDTLHRKDAREFPPGKAAEVLAAEVERLEAECLEAKCYMVQHARERGREMQRAEAAEARAKELELKLMRQDEVAREAYEAAVWKYGQERMELEAQNARLRAALEGAAKAVEALLIFSHQHTPAPFLREQNALREIKDALNGEEAST